MMKNPKEIIDGFDGLLTKEQALALYSESRLEAMPKMPLSAEYVSRLLSNDAKGILSGLAKEKIDLQDEVYRVFNPSTKNFGESETFSRTVVLGSEGSTVNISLNKKTSDMLDSLKIERGDTILFKSLIIDIKTASFKSTPATSIDKLAQSHSGINDFSRIKSNMNAVDVVGNVIEVDSIRHVSRANGSSIPAVKIVLSDGKTTLNVACWGQSALVAASLPLNLKVKLEFCKAIDRSGIIEMRADELSRLLVL
ncbi:MAG: hypothetical protein M1465_00385 [Candidatus Marsarchaeota archaeon]|nr:hypothetical protein [Candidatus Marsarchaeota archaeon]